VSDGNHLITRTNTQSPDRQGERSGARSNSDDVLDSELVRELAFGLFHLGAVDEMPVRQDSIDGREDPLPFPLVSKARFGQVVQRSSSVRLARRSPVC
jgi:hypothetical protein